MCNFFVIEDLEYLLEKQSDTKRKRAYALTHKPFFDNLIVAFFANDFDPRQVKS